MLYEYLDMKKTNVNVICSTPEPEQRDVETASARISLFAQITGSFRHHLLSSLSSVWIENDRTMVL